MLDDLWALTLETYRAPRAGVRRAIEAFDTFERIALLFGLSICLVIATVVGLSLIKGSDVTGGAGAISFLASSLVAQTMGFIVSVAIVYVVGGWFGGVGRPKEIATAIAWHSFVSAVPGGVVQALVLAQPESGVASLGILLIVAVAFWLFVNFVAEAHRFASVWRVTGVVLGGVIALSFVIAIFSVIAISPA